MKNKRIKISQGLVIDPANQVNKKTDLYIANGKIIALGKTPAGFKPDREINAENCIVMPGIVDLSIRLREPGEEHKANITSELSAAVSGGITSVCCPPDTNPVIDSASVVELILQRALLAKKAHVYPLGALTNRLEDKSLSEMWTLKSAGCIGVSNAYMPVENTELLRRSLEYAATCKQTVHLYCEDNYLRNNGVVHDGYMNIRQGLLGIPVTAETVAISKALLLIEQCETRVHFCRISSRQGMALIADAKARGLPVTADVSIAHLYLTETDTDDFNANCHLRPPLRETGDRDALLEGITDGTIDAICSDHQPHNFEAKSAPFSLTEPGASTIDCLLSLSMQLKDKIDLVQIIASLTCRPADIAGIEAGTLSPDSRADVCIFDPAIDWSVNNTTIHSAGKNSPFSGWEISGRVIHTLVDGQVVFSREHR